MASSFPYCARLKVLAVIVCWGTLANIYILSRVTNEKHESSKTTTEKRGLFRPAFRLDRIQRGAHYAVTCKNILPAKWPELPRHGCRSHTKTKMVFCQMQDLRINSQHMECTRGGEDLRDVWGKRDKEEVEFPIYAKGALTIPKELDVPNNMNLDQAHYIKDVLQSLSVVEKSMTCQLTRTDPTLFITRYEYANLYHTMTDFFNAFLAFRLLDESEATTTIDVVFLDGHAQGHLDPMWQRLFGGQVTHVKHIAENVCFSRVIFIPAGYSAPIWRRDRSIPPCRTMMEAFESFVLSRLRLQHVLMERGRITIIDRVPYISHPRSSTLDQGDKRIITNLKELETMLSRHVEGVSSVDLVRMEEMSVAEQIKLVRQSHILIGNHGAALSHLLFMHPNSVVIEFQDPKGNDVFAELITWKQGIQHVIMPSVHGPTLSRTIMHRVEATVQSILL